MAAPSPSLPLSPAAAPLRSLRTAPGTAAGGEELGRGWGAAARPQHPKERRASRPRRLQVHTKGSVIHPLRTHKNLRPPPHARHTLHGDGRVALLRVLGALHLQLLGRERPIRAA